jgi:hypothetical protein
MKFETNNNLESLTENYSQKFKNIGEISNKLTELNDKILNIAYIVVNIPENVLRQDLNFLKNVEIVDLIGVPDNSIKNAYELNSIFLKDNLDCLFIVKCSIIDRGEICQKDIVELHRCLLFDQFSFSKKSFF